MCCCYVVLSFVCGNVAAVLVNVTLLCWLFYCLYKLIVFCTNVHVVVG